MSLSKATAHTQTLPALPERVGLGFPCRDLQDWLGLSFWLPALDPRLQNIHFGEPAPTEPLENLEGMVRYWTEHPEWMDFLDPNSPTHEDKMLERALYVEYWGDILNAATRVLDVGGGVGRLGQIPLQNGAELQVIEPDLRSIWRNLSHSIGATGSIDFHWCTAEHMPDLGRFDTALACEVLNYVEDPHKVVSNIYQSLKPGGKLLMSVEARWGWPMARDVAPDTLEAFFETGIVHVPHDRWIRTYTEESIRELLKEFNITFIQRSHYTLSGPFEWAMGDATIEELIAYENRLRQHPIAKDLNRAWMVIAEKPL